MNRCRAQLLAVFLMTLVGVAWAGGEDKEGAQVRLELSLVDGSRIIGTPIIKSVPVQTSYSKTDISLKKILTIRIEENHETASIDLQGGDKIKGVISLEPIKLETTFGTVSVGTELIRELRVVLSGPGLPAGEGPLSFGGVNWIPWRTAFAVQGDKLISLPEARPGFNFDGREGPSPMLLSNTGSAAWKDYSVEFEYCMHGVARAYRMPAISPQRPIYLGGSIMFHVVYAFEKFVYGSSWSAYTLSFGADGSWSLGSSYYIHVPAGWAIPSGENNRTLAQGRGLKFDHTDGNKFRIDVCGTHIQVWVDGAPLIDLRDEKMGERIGDQVLDHGGVGFQWESASTGWIRRFSARQLQCETTGQ